MGQTIGRVLFVAGLSLALHAGLTTGTHALSPDAAPALPPPSGNVVTVSTESELQNAIGNVASNQTIVIAPGTYHLTSTLWINGGFSNVTIRGATNDRNDVVLVGRGMGVPDNSVPFGIWTGGGVTGVTIANLTIRDIYQHPLVFNAGTQSPRVYNVRLLNAGEQFLKANPDGAGGGVNNGVVEYSVLEYSTTAPNDYTNGVDVHTGQNWVIRHNLFRRIRAPEGMLAGPAILMWNGSSGTIAEGNTFIDCHRDIAFGLIERSPNDHTGGIIRNNMIVRTAGAGGDVGIGVMDSPGTVVVNNTIFMNGQYPSAIEYRFPHTSGVTITNNLSDRGAQARDGATASLQANVWTATASWFVSAASGDLHLVPTASGAIDRGVVTSGATVDWDGEPRLIGASVDVGADEVGGAAPPQDTTAPSVTLSAPAAGATVSGTTTFAATATDNVGVAGVWFTVDGTTVGTEDTSAPYSIGWNSTTATNGNHVIRAMARDAAGNTGSSSTVTVTVSNTTPDTTLPNVSMTAPASNSTVSGTVTVSASASDNVGVVGVRFTLDGVPLGAEDTSAPFSITWNTATTSNGSHVLRAVARDAAGNTRTSSARTVTVSNAVVDTTPPNVSITTPSAGSSVSGSVTLSASASDNVAVVGVQFFVDGIAVGGEDTAAPYSLSWPSGSVRNGYRVVAARARDAAGNTRTSDGVTVRIRNWGSRVAGDLDDNGTADLVFRSAAGALTSWLLTGASRSSVLTLTPAALNPAWVLASVDDLDVDGKSDFLWQHSATGQLYAWYMDRGVLIGEGYVSQTTTPWRVLTTGDFNRDGHVDFLWMSPSGSLAVWYMVNGTMASSVPFGPGRVDPVWRLAGTGDFNRDGGVDVLWQNRHTGAIHAWMMSATTVIWSGPLTPGATNPAWEVRAVVDLDRNGHSDLVFQHSTAGHLYAWFLNGTTLMSDHYFSPSQIDPAWQLVGQR